jgi:hypothetical protein
LAQYRHNAAFLHLSARDGKPDPTKQRKINAIDPKRTSTRSVKIEDAAMPEVDQE